jgi:hypothetical protein
MIKFSLMLDRGGRNDAEMQEVWIGANDQK